MNKPTNTIDLIVRGCQKGHDIINELMSNSTQPTDQEALQAYQNQRAALDGARQFVKESEAAELAAAGKLANFLTNDTRIAPAETIAQQALQLKTAHRLAEQTVLIARKREELALVNAQAAATVYGEFATYTAHLLVEQTRTIEEKVLLQVVSDRLEHEAVLRERSVGMSAALHAQQITGTYPGFDGSEIGTIAAALDQARAGLDELRKLARIK